jgi:ElaB/YqjD/DUF883 family membrane-anchored ribosome-binding protein
MNERIEAVAGHNGASAGLKEQALEAAATVKESLGKGSKLVSEYIVKEPAKALGMALGVGVLLGWLIKRR